MNRYASQILQSFSIWFEGAEQEQDKTVKKFSEVGWEVFGAGVSGLISPLVRLAVI